MVKKVKSVKYFEAVGRRKLAVARVRLYLVNKEKFAMIGTEKIKAGEILVNHRPVEKFFTTVSDKIQYLTPFKLTKSEDRFATSILIKGGGMIGQLTAVMLGVSRALEKVGKEAYRPILKKAGLLTVDARARERRKVGTGGKARRAKQSPKR